MVSVHKKGSLCMRANYKYSLVVHYSSIKEYFLTRLLLSKVINRNLRS